MIDALLQRTSDHGRAGTHRPAGGGAAGGPSSERPHSAVRLGLVTALVAGTVAGVLAGAAPASAATSPVIGRTAGTVSADALPTAQIDGVAWTQTVVGNTVYVGGSFATARPAGAAAGVNTTARPNLMSYDVTSGAMTSWAPVLNNQVYAVAASPDGTRVYVGGQFTTVNGVTRQRIAAFDTATGALIASFAPKLNYIVKSLAVTNSTVYAGGSFATVGSTTRNRLAAFDATSGALLPWNPSADAVVNALTIAPDGSKVIVGGAFQNLGGTAAYGLAAVDPVTGAVVPWAAPATVRDAGTKAAILSLSTDGRAIYGSGYVFGGGGNLEGAFSADPTTGAISWIEDCHGDTYGVFSTGSTVYSVGHAHYCGNVGGYPETSPRSYHYALAWTPQATGTIGHDPYGYFDWYGKPSPSMQNWFPDLDIGSYTGVSQAAWSVAGDSRYVVLGGEFPKVNGVAQQGLVRFAVDGIAPDKQGPMVSGTNWTPTTVAVSNGVRVSIPADWDRDDTTLTYTVIRNSNTGSPAARFTADSTFWNRPTVGMVDTTVAPGATATYRIVAADPHGNQVSSATVTGTGGPAVTVSAYAKAVVADGASHYWRLDETTGSTSYDQAGYDDLTSAGGVTGGQTGAVTGDSDTAANFSGATNGFAATTTAVTSPDVFTEEAWVKTTSTAGGKIVGFGNRSTGTSTTADRHVYLDTSGKVWFGVANNGNYTVRSATAINDGQWHQIVSTLDPTGLTLFVDGKRVARNAGTTSAADYRGFWRVGGDTTWSGAPFLNGTIDDVAIYPSALTAAQVERHYALSGRALPGTAAPTDRYGTAVMASSPDLYLRLDDASGRTALDSSGNGASGTFFGGETYGVASPVTGGSGTAVRFDGNEGSEVSSGPYPGPTVYSEELWFSTTTTRGGKLIGFGSAAGGRSPNNDRAVTMQPGGQLVFGVYPGSQVTVQSSAAYNDGAWHHLVATQGPSGMRLYVDDALVGSNTVTGQQAYDGYWRVGGDTAWNNTAYFAGTIDEAAVYTTALSASEVDAHFHASPVGGVANQPPTARFTSAAADLTATFDASTSSDPDGTIASYAWTFGDGTSGTGVTPSHPYTVAGTYPVGLTVTDNSGATATSSGTVTVSAPAPTAYATDAFGRTVTNGWGAADVGGAWTVKGPGAATWAVGSGQGSVPVPAGYTATAELAAVAALASDSTVDLTLDKLPTGGGTMLWLAARHVGSSDYRIRAKILATGVVQVSLSKVVNGTDTAVASGTVAGLTYRAGTTLRVRLQVTGTSSVSITGKVWDATTTEPAAWQVTATDASATLGAGSTLVSAYVSSSATNGPQRWSVDNLSVRQP